jgi:hypothetical protein
MKGKEVEKLPSKKQVSKKWFKSKTLWFNIIALILGVITTLVDIFPTIATSEIIVLIMSFGNMILRFFTKESLCK